MIKATQDPCIGNPARFHTARFETIQWTVNFREDDYKVVYAQLNGSQVGASQNWHSGRLDSADVRALQEMLCSAYEAGRKDMRGDIKRALGL